jgi:hypothetical protein
MKSDRDGDSLARRARSSVRFCGNSEDDTVVVVVAVVKEKGFVVDLRFLATVLNREYIISLVS